MLEDEVYDYDSTWADSEEDPEPPKEKEAMQLGTADEPYRWRNRRAAKDLQHYRHSYPGLSDKVNGDVNFKFYMNKEYSQPDNCTIDWMITNWKGKYEHLERNHSYIQWLFPLREPGMNFYAKELTRQEIQEIKEQVLPCEEEGYGSVRLPSCSSRVTLFKRTKDARKRLIKAYRMMLDFYGILLVNRKSGEVKRANHWRERFYNLNLHPHNNLRITRILKCLGEMGFEHYQSPLVKFFLTETLINKQLPRVKESVLDYFLYTIRSKSERRKLILYAQQHYQPLVDFVWGPPKGTEHRFSHILEELKKEEVKVQETTSEKASDEDMSNEDDKTSYMPSETVDGRNQKRGCLTKQRSSDSMEKSTNCVKDSEESSEDHIETRTLDAATSQEQCSAEEKSNGDGKSPVSENKSPQNGNIEKQTECEEEVVAEGSKPNIEELVQGSDVLKNCETKLKEKTEDDLEKFEVQPQVVATESTCRKETESKEKLLSSIEPELGTSEEDKPTMGEPDEIAEEQLATIEKGKLAIVESKIGNIATREMDEIAEEQLATIEEDKLATVGNKTGNIATGEMDEIAKPKLVTTEENNLATEGSKIGNTGTTETNEIAESEPVTTEKDKRAKEEDKIRNTVMGGQKNVLPELEIHEGQNKSVSEREIQSSTKDESECVEEMETQEGSLASTMEDIKCPGGKGMEMEIEDVKCPGDKGLEMEIEDVKCLWEKGMEVEIEDDVEMEDGQ